MSPFISIPWCESWLRRCLWWCGCDRVSDEPDLDRLLLVQKTICRSTLSLTRTEPTAATHRDPGSVSFDRAAAGQVTTLSLSDTCHSARRGASSWCQLRRLTKRMRIWLDRWVYVPTCSRKVILTNKRAFFLIYLYGIERVDLPFAVWHLWWVSPNPGKYVV